MGEIRPSTLERAFDLARSGAVKSIYELRRKLNHEGYSADQIEGPQLIAQIRTIIHEQPPEPE
jgi:hypothetical protein